MLDEVWEAFLQTLPQTYTAAEWKKMRKGQPLIKVDWVPWGTKRVIVTLKDSTTQKDGATQIQVEYTKE